MGSDASSLTGSPTPSEPLPIQFPSECSALVAHFPNLRGHTQYSLWHVLLFLLLNPPGDILHSHDFILPLMIPPRDLTEVQMIRNSTFQPLHLSV